MFLWISVNGLLTFLSSPFSPSVCMQLLISGSVDGFDVDDLRSNANYAGGYHRVSSSACVLYYLFFFSIFLVWINCLIEREKLDVRFNICFSSKLMKMLYLVKHYCINICTGFGLFFAAYESTCDFWQEHYVIEMFWEVLKNFSMENQRKFLKWVKFFRLCSKLSDIYYLLLFSFLVCACVSLWTVVSLAPKEKGKLEKTISQIELHPKFLSIMYPLFSELLTVDSYIGRILQKIQSWTIGSCVHLGYSRDLTCHVPNTFR